MNNALLYSGSEIHQDLIIHRGFDSIVGISGLPYFDSSLHLLKLSFLNSCLHNNLILMQSWDVKVGGNLIRQFMIWFKFQTLKMCSGGKLPIPDKVTE